MNPPEKPPSEAEIDHARSSLSGRNRELLDTVGNAVKEELLRVKDALDLHLRTGNDVHELEPQVAELGRANFVVERGPDGAMRLKSEPVPAMPEELKKIIAEAK